MECFTPWTQIERVVAAVTPLGEGEMFVIGIEADHGNGTRLFVVTENHPIWAGLTSMLPVWLVGCKAFEEWGPILAQKPSVVMLYERPDPKVAS